jgi:hypothetical protein
LAFICPPPPSLPSFGLQVGGADNDAERAEQHEKFGSVARRREDLSLVSEL